jgi:hypothetical protein
VNRERTPTGGSAGPAANADAPPAVYVRPTYFPWADRVFALDIFACPACGGRLRSLATIEVRTAVEKILTRRGLPVELPPSAARTPAWLPGVCERSDHQPDVGGHWADWPPCPLPDGRAALAAHRCVRASP